MSGADPLLRVELAAGYGARTILEDVRFDLQAGAALGLVGTSGAGKSTLTLALLGLLPWRGGWARGEVLLNGANLLTMRERDARALRGKAVALVPQSPMSALNPAVSLRAHFEQSWKAHSRAGLGALEERLRELLPQVQLDADPAWLRRRPEAVSVGQAQRVLIALALLHRPALLIADEPTSALDPVTQAEIVKLLRQLNRTTGTALLYISHDLLSVLQVCEEVAVLDRGTLVERVAVTELGGRQHHPALAGLLAALPVPAEVLLGYRDVAG